MIVSVGGERAARETLTRDPRRDAARLPAPLLVVHGTRDETVPFADAGQLVSTRRDAALPVQRLVIRGADHSLAVDDRTPPAAWDRITGFLRAPR